MVASTVQFAHVVSKAALTVSAGERTVAARISTIAVDRDGDVILPSGIQLADYKKNPVVLFAHDSWSLPVAKAIKIEKRSDGVDAVLQFAERPASLPEQQEWPPDTLFDMFKQKILHAFSVGIAILESHEASLREVSRFGEGLRRVIGKSSLLEFSIVPVPANQDALVTAVSKGIIKRSWVTDAWNVQPLELDSHMDDALSLDSYV